MRQRRADFVEPRDRLITADAVQCAEAIVARAGPRLVMAIPVGIGKPVNLVNALYRRVAEDSRLSLKIFTGLTLVRPQYRSDLERRFVAPLLERLFAGLPDLAYVEPLRRGRLPANIEVHEFFLQAGQWLASPPVQSGYVSVNYTGVAGELQRLGVNVLAQVVAPDPAGGASVHSLGGNTDVTWDLDPYVQARRQAGLPIVVAAEENRNMPYMLGEALGERANLDVLLQPAEPHYPLFAPPKEPVPLGDYAMAFHAASLVEDGGTLQIGIGSFADALCHALVLRHRQNAAFREILAALGGPSPAASDLAPFASGLYACSEMLVDGFLALRREGIVKRRVEVAPEGEAGGGRRPALIHAGFFVGSKAFYEELRGLSTEELEEICMTSISFTNTLAGDEDRKRRQRRAARFINTGMIATLLGAISSDQLEDGRVVSGVGGQHDFAVMAHQLADARSVIVVRATRRQAGRLRSNIVWSYGNTTLPRPLRDLVVTEHGVADLRGRPDGEVVAAMLEVTDRAFQADLAREAAAAGKLARRHQVSARAAGNSAERIRAVLAPWREKGLLPVFPLGTEMTEAEQSLVPPLARLKSEGPLGAIRLLLAGLRSGRPGEGERAALARLGLERPAGLRENLMRALVLGAMRR